MKDYLTLLATAHPYDYDDTCSVELWDFSESNLNEESRIETVTTVASLSYGNEKAKNPFKLYSLLIKQGHESVFEFVRYVHPQTGYTGKIEHSLRVTHIPTIENAVCITALSIDSFILYHKQYVATFKINVPIFVMRQIVRHRSFSYLELSRRYVTGEKVPFEVWKPPQSDELGITNALATEYGLLCQLQEALRNRGLKPEQARAFLPLGTYTRVWMQGDVDAWINFFVHRLSPHAQTETRLVAEKMLSLLKEYQPEFIENLKERVDRWVSNGVNPLFAGARKRLAKEFKERYLRV